MSPTEIGVTIKRLREEKGWSQLALAKRAKVPQSYISELEAGDKRNPGIETLRKLAKALRKPVTALLG
jgi:transcriptional regulator with XRE-family HTH domain